MFNKVGLDHWLQSLAHLDECGQGKQHVNLGKKKKLCSAKPT